MFIYSYLFLFPEYITVCFGSWWLRDIVRRNLWFGSVAQKTVILDYQEEQGLLDKKRSVSFTCDFARDECIYSNRLVSGIVIILMFMYKNQNELSKYPV